MSGRTSGAGSPYDGLNSTIFRRLPYISGKRLPRLAWIQFMKRSPFNLRPVLGVKKEHNPKGLGLFLADGRDLALRRGLFLDLLHRRRGDDGGNGEVFIRVRRLGAFGSLTWLMWSVSPISSPVRSMWISFGISAASQTSARS